MYNPFQIFANKIFPIVINSNTKSHDINSTIVILFHQISLRIMYEIHYKMNEAWNDLYPHKKQNIKPKLLESPPETRVDPRAENRKKEYSISSVYISRRHFGPEARRWAGRRGREALPIFLEPAEGKRSRTGDGRGEVRRADGCEGG